MFNMETSHHINHIFNIPIYYRKRIFYHTIIVMLLSMQLPVGYSFSECNLNIKCWSYFYYFSFRTYFILTRCNEGYDNLENTYCNRGCLSYSPNALPILIPLTKNLSPKLSMNLQLIFHDLMTSLMFKKTKRMFNLLNGN